LINVIFVSVVIEDDLTKLEFVMTLVVLEVAKDALSGSTKLWEIKCVPSVAIKMEFDMSDLLPAVCHRVEDAHFDIVRISVGTIVGGFKSYALEV
jgi:hypothetical protein